MAYFLISQLHVYLLKTVQSFNIKYLPREHIITKLIKHNKLRGIKYLFSKGINLRMFDDYAMREACRHGRIEIVKYLIQTVGASVQSQNNYALRIARSDYARMTMGREY